MRSCGWVLRTNLVLTGSENMHGEFSFTFHSCFHTFIHVGFVNILKKKRWHCWFLCKSLPCTPYMLVSRIMVVAIDLTCQLSALALVVTQVVYVWISCMSNCFRIPSRRPKYNRLRPKQPCIHFHWSKKFPERWNHKALYPKNCRRSSALWQSIMLKLLHGIIYILFSYQSHF